MVGGRSLVGWSYLLALALGAGLAILLIVDGHEKYVTSAAQYGADWPRFDGWRVLQHAGTGVVLLVQTLALITISVGRRIDWLVVPVYLASYTTCFISSWLSLMVAGKDFEGRGMLAQLALPGLFLACLVLGSWLLVAHLLRARAGRTIP